MQHPFALLTPGRIMAAVESLGYRCDCRTLALNSYENRVYQVGIEEGEPLIVKFYRPGRWSDAQIREEHQFCLELSDHELPVVAPVADPQGETLFRHGEFRFALYPRQGGHAPELDNLENLRIIGRLLGRLHAVGATRPFSSRPSLESRNFGYDSAALVSERCIPPELKANYDILCRDLLQAIDQILAEVAPRRIRVHDDFHSGNLLWRHPGPHLVDLDDSRMAPAVQDLWMLLCGDRPRQLAQLTALLEGYSEFHAFAERELRLVEVLRSLRLLHFSAWLAQRWDDPTFPLHFPWFATPRYWDEQILALREQIAALGEPPLHLS